MAAKITGRVTEVLVDEGMPVEAGQVLARLDDADAAIAAGLRLVAEGAVEIIQRSPEGFGVVVKILVGEDGRVLEAEIMTGVHEFLDAAAVLKETSALPAVCGRVCPQEVQCEQACFYTQKLKKPPVAIGYLERFVADF